VYLNLMEDQTEKLEYHCFSCGAHGEWTEELITPEMRQRVEKQKDDTKYMGLKYGGQYEALTNASDPWGYRGISQEICERFGVKVIRDERGPKIVFPYYDISGNLIAQKIRKPNFIREDGKVKRVFTWYKVDENSLANISLFGAQRFKAGQGKITIVFGEFDALAVSQMMGGDWPVVSVPNGDDNAIQAIKDNFQYLDQFEEIILCPDNDAAGQKVVTPISAMFPRKVRVMRWSDLDLKDANDFLKAGKGQDFKNIWWSAPGILPEKVKDFGDLRKLVFEKPKEPIASYPFSTLNEMVGGLWEGDLVGIKAHPKVGKTTLCCEVAKHIIDTTDLKVGLIYLEDSERDVLDRFITMQVGETYSAPTYVRSTLKIS